LIAFGDPGHIIQPVPKAVEVVGRPRQDQRKLPNKMVVCPVQVRGELEQHVKHRNALVSFQF
jgi:hypothetical protein